MSNRLKKSHNKKKAPPRSSQFVRQRALELENEALKSRVSALLHEKTELEDIVAAYEQSTSWRITASIRALRRALFWLTGSKSNFQASGVVQRHGATPLCYELIAVKDLIRDGEGNWIATGVNAQLEVCFDGDTLRSGWYNLTLEAEIMGVAHRLSPEWYMDQGYGLQTANQSVLARSGLKFSTVFFSAENIVRLRIDPCSSDGLIGRFAVHITRSNRFRAYGYLRLQRKRLHDAGNERSAEPVPGWRHLSSCWFNWQPRTR